MTCTQCGATIAAKALICYRCGTATTEARHKPATEGSLFDRPRRRVPIWLWILIIAALVALGVFAYTQDMLMAEAAGRYVDAHRAAVAGRGPSVTVVDVLEPARRASVEQGAAWGGGVLGVGAAVAVVVGRALRSRPADRRPGSSPRE